MFNKLFVSTLIFLFLSFPSFSAISLSNRSICQNDPTSHLIWTPPSGGYTYCSWFKLPSRTLISTSTSGLIRSFHDTGTYRLVIYTSSFSIIDSSNDVILSMTPSPNSGTLYGSDTICLHSSITLYNIGHTTPSTLTWNGWLNTTNNSLFSYTTGDTGIVYGYRVGIDTIIYISETNSSFGSCGMDTTYKLLTISPTSAGIITGPDSICVDSMLTLTDTISGGIWTTTGLLSIFSSGPNYAQFTSTSSGVDNISYTISNTCGTYVTTKSITVVDCNLGIKSIDRFVSIYPNPTYNFININIDRISTISIMDMMGRVVYNSISSSIRIDMTDYIKGMYVVKIDGVDYKIIKE